ncbi:phosphatase PAP2 family protein [Flavobacterium ovatum]|uniref:phosphatase PAP2 family protein n=1 Tax=Flavobacterium ovatum TaxID=1928857 RepID=UPI00344D9704
MKNYFFVVLILMSNLIHCQSLDSLSTTKKISYTPFYVSAGLVTTGALLLNTTINQDIQNKADSRFGPNFHTQLDNVTVFVPMAQIYAGKLLGFEPKNNSKHQTISIITANVLTYVLVTGLKNTVKANRPDDSDQLSFPSGHSAIAFTNAALLFQEYKDSSIWYASSGFLFATATGMLRIANNKHYASDVLAGAGIGLATGFLVSYYNPLQNLHFGKKNKGTALIYPQFGNQIGIGAIIRPNF